MMGLSGSPVCGYLQGGRNGLLAVWNYKIEGKISRADKINDRLQNNGMTFGGRGMVQNVEQKETFYF